MKSKRLSRLPFVLFIIIAVFLLFFVIFNATYIKSHNKVVRPKVITPQSSSSASSGVTMDTLEDAENSVTSFITLQSNETLMSTLIMDFDGDSMDDQIVAVRKSGSSNLVLIVGLYNQDTQGYDRAAEIQTEISKIRTFSYCGIDMIGNHQNSLVYQGVKANGDSVMKIFNCKKRKFTTDVVTIGDFTSDGTIFIQQTDRSDAYELNQSLGQCYSVWVYSSDKSEEGDKGSVSQIQTEYKWSYDSRKYIQNKQLKITGSRMAAKELSRIQNGSVDTFAQFLNGLWYKTKNNGTDSYIYFNYDNKEVIFLNDDTEGVYSWENSSLRRSGIYLTTVNTIISTMKRRFDIMLTGVNEINVTVHDDVGLIIRESNSWNGQYKKMAFQNTFSEVTEKQKSDEFFEILSKGAVFNDDNNLTYSFKGNTYSITDGKEEEGIFVISTVGDYSVIQFRSSTQTLLPSYALKFDSHEVVIPPRTKKEKSRKETVYDKDKIILTPVSISVKSCYPVDGKVITLHREASSKE